MRIKNMLTALMIAFAMVLSVAGCGGAGAQDEGGSNEGTTAEGIREIYNYDAEEKKQTLFFGSRGSGCIFWHEGGHESENAFRIGSRGNNWEGVSLNLADKDVVGKKLYVSFWVYHESDTPFSIGCTLQILKPDMVTEDWPESIWTEEISAGEWVFVEGEIPVYTDATSPQLNFEANATYDFMLDDIKVTVDDNSTTEAKYGDITASMEEFKGVSLDFEDGEVYFEARGAASAAITGDAHGGSKALLVTGRTESWEGIEKDLTGTKVQGKTVEIKCWMKNNEEKPLTLAITMEEENSSRQTTYNSLVYQENVAPGEWIEVTGSLEVGEDTIRPILYFESADATASFSIDDIVITVSE